MDLLYTRNFDGFCIVSSDSDFTRLASRIRESGLAVYGFGKRQTPKAFIGACDKFIYTEILKELEEATVPPSKPSLAASDAIAKQKSVEPQNLANNQTLIQLLKDAYEALADEDGWVELGLFGNRLTQISPDFDPRNYGFKQLKKMMKAIELFEIRETPQEKNPDNKTTHIKLKP